MHAGAAADDLLELGHRANRAAEHNQPTRLHIDAGREQTRRGDENGVLRFRVDEIAELVLPLGIAAGDAHDIAGVPVDEIDVLVNQRLTHSRACS